MGGKKSIARTSSVLVEEMYRKYGCDDRLYLLGFFSSLPVSEVRIFCEDL